MDENDPANARKRRKESTSNRKRTSSKDKRSNPSVSSDAFLTYNPLNGSLPPLSLSNRSSTQIYNIAGLSISSAHPQPTIRNTMPLSDITNFSQRHVLSNTTTNANRTQSNSFGSFGHSNSKHPINRDIMNEVKDVLDTSSDLVKTFRRARDRTVVFPSSEQSKLTCDTYLNIRSSIAVGNTDPTIIGKLVMLSSSFTGGPRYIRQNYMDAMALCRWYGCLDLFITITCNPNWPEIARYIREHNLTLTDRPDVLSRVFKMKLDQLMKDVKELRLFGRVQAGNVQNTFPKKFMQHSSVDSEGYPVYRRRDNKKYVEKSGHHLHNGFIILYNATLLKRYQCHINVEWCNQTGSIKYLFKYINKGPDRVSAELYEPATMVDGEQIQKPIDEIKAYLDYGYLSACEAAWRLFGFEVQYRTPSVERLSFHLSGWMRMNELYPAARELTYAEFLTKMLLNSAKGSRMHDEIKKVNGVVYPTYKEACYATGLLEDDKEYIEYLVVSDEKKKCRFVLYRRTLRSRGKTFRHWPEMPYPDKRYISEFGNRLIYDELDYNPAELQSEYERLYVSLNTKQKSVYDTIMNSVETRQGGRTAHSIFHIPINIDETSTFSICPQSDLGALLKKCKLIIWDEAPITNKLCFEALDRTLRDVLRRTRDRELGEANDGEVSIDVPEELLIDAVEDSVTSIIDFTYPNLLNNINSSSYFQEKAILAPTNEVVDTINDHLLNKFPGEEMVYLSCDSIDKTERGFAIDEAIFSPEFIYGLKFSGKIITGTHFGKEVIIPRLRSTPSDKRLPIKIVRKQYPLSLLFAMTINKSQGQSISKVSLYLPRPVFTHGQLYVALSRVKSKRGLKDVVCDEEGNVSKTTTNVVYKKVLHGL
nr:putative PIF1 DNA helicase/replication protein A1-like protein [Tanacetum cinerariifolium]